MDAINATLTQIGNWCCAPFASHPTACLLFWSVVTGIVMTYVFGKTSNQTALRRTADRIRAQLLAVKLFKDDLTVTFQCQLVLMKATGWRLLHSVPPMLVMIVPLLFVLVQLALRYEYRPLVPGEQAVVTLQLKPDAWKQFQDVQLETTESVVAETGSLRDAKNASLHWRVRAVEPKNARLSWKIGKSIVEKNLSIADHQDLLQPTNPKRPGPIFWDRVFYPGEPGLPDCPVASIQIQFTPRTTPVLGFNVPWWATFFAVSMLVAFLIGKVIGVQY